MPLDLNELKSPPVDMADLDAVNYAGAVAASAAGRLYALLTDPDRQFDYRWFTDNAEIALDDVEQTMDLLADYVCVKRETNPETLYRHAGYERICEANDWFGEGVPRKLAWTLFQSTCLAVFDVIDREQKTIQKQRAQEEAVKVNPPLALEDSIFRPEPGLGELLPHAVEASQAAAARQQQEEEAAAAAEIETASDEAGPMSAAAPLEEDAIVAAAAAEIETASDEAGPMSAAAPLEEDAIVAAAPAEDAAAQDGPIGGDVPGEPIATLSNAGSMSDGAKSVPPLSGKPLAGTLHAPADTAADTSDGTTPTQPEPEPAKKRSKPN